MFIIVFLSTTTSVEAKFTSSKKITGTIHVPENNYCINKGFNTLSDCMLVMDNYKESVESAKTTIESKGTPNFANIAPIISYVETEWIDYPSVLSTNNYYYVGETYSFNDTTGVFSLENTTKVTGDSTHSSYVGKYTCASTVSSSCSSIYKIEADTNDGTTYKITKSKKKTYSVLQSFDSDNGLYMAEDDLGKSYYYRGSVNNNLVSFAGKYWKIIRRNGDGSVRLMYFSDSSTTQGKNAVTTQFNSNYWDPTYVGFMYNDSDFSSVEVTSNIATFSNFLENTTYYYGKNYSWDASTKRFKLTGTFADGDIIKGTWKDTYEQIISDDYIYSCFGTSETENCPVLMKITGYTNANLAKVQYISYSSTS